MGEGGEGREKGEGRRGGEKGGGKERRAEGKKGKGR